MNSELLVSRDQDHLAADAWIVSLGAAALRYLATLLVAIAVTAPLLMLMGWHALLWSIAPYMATGLLLDICIYRPLAVRPELWFTAGVGATVLAMFWPLGYPAVFVRQLMARRA